MFALPPAVDSRDKVTKRNNVGVGLRSAQRALECDGWQSSARSEKNSVSISSEFFFCVVTTEIVTFDV